MTKIRPLYDRVVVKKHDLQKTEGGILIPDTVEKPSIGEVVAVGEGYREDGGAITPLKVRVGDRVTFAKYSGSEFEQNGSKLLVMREDDILAVLE